MQFKNHFKIKNNKFALLFYKKFRTIVIHIKCKFIFGVKIESIRLYTYCSTIICILKLKT